MATLQQIRDFAREVLQTDSTDLPDSLVDVFANESVQRVLGLRDDWPHLYSEGTLSMVASDGIYALNSASFNPTTFTTIESLWDDAVFGRSLVEVDHQGAAATWIGPSASITNDPYYFSVYGGNVYLWPVPNASRTLRVGGYRSPNTMSSGSDTPDLPTVFHPAIQYGTCAIAFAQQEDPELAQFWRNMANESVGVAIRNLFMNRRHRPIMLWGKGQHYGMSYPEWVRRNV